MTRSYWNSGRGEVLGGRVTILGWAVSSVRVVDAPRSTCSLLPRSMTLRRFFERA